MLRSLRFVNWSYFLVLNRFQLSNIIHFPMLWSKFIATPQLKLNSVCDLLQLRLADNFVVSSGNLLFNLRKTFIPQATLWRIIFTSSSSFSLQSCQDTLRQINFLFFRCRPSKWCLRLFSWRWILYTLFCVFTINWDLAKKPTVFEILCSSFIFDGISSMLDLKMKISSTYWTTIQSSSTIIAKSFT